MEVQSRRSFSCGFSEKHDPKMKKLFLSPTSNHKSQLVVTLYARLPSNELHCNNSVTASCHKPSDTLGSWWTCTWTLSSQWNKLSSSWVGETFSSAAADFPESSSFLFFSQTVQIRCGLKSCFCSLLNGREAEQKVLSCWNGFRVCVCVCFLTVHSQSLWKSLLMHLSR